jgi:hypothetical protein
MITKSVILLVREDIEKHPILKSVKNYFCDSDIDLNVCDLRQGLRADSKNYDLAIVSDPLVYLIWLVFYRNSKLVLFFSLEMFEYQLPSKGLKNNLRNLLFRFAHWICLKRCFSVFPNDIRRRFYLDKKWTELDRSKVLFNVPSKNLLELSREVKLKISKAEARSRLLKYLNISAESTLYIYAGSIDIGSRGAGVILDAFKSANKAALVIVGRDKDKIFSKRYSLGDGNVFYLGEKKQAEIVSLLWACDYGVAYYSSDVLNTKYCAPVKLYEYSMMELPLVCNKNEGVLSAWGRDCFYYESASDLSKLVKDLKQTSTKDGYTQKEMVSFEKQLEELMRYVEKNN